MGEEALLGGADFSNGPDGSQGTVEGVKKPGGAPPQSLLPLTQSFLFLCGVLPPCEHIESLEKLLHLRYNSTG